MKSNNLIFMVLVSVFWSGLVCADISAQQIAESNAAKWNKAFSHGQVDEILSLYTDNAILVQPNGSVSKNIGEIRVFWQTLIETRSGVLAIDVIDIKSEQEDTIVTTMRISEVKTLAAAAQVMKYQYDGVLYSVLKRQRDGSWKAQAQQWRYMGRGV